MEILMPSTFNILSWNEFDGEKLLSPDKNLHKSITWTQIYVIFKISAWKLSRKFCGRER